MPLVPKSGQGLVVTGEKQQGLAALQRGKAFDPAIVDCFMRHSTEMLALRLSITECRMNFADLVQAEQPAP